MSDQQTIKRTLTGVVVSDKMTNSIVVNTEKTVKHSFYKKMIKVHKKYMADDPQNRCVIGDRVLIEECRPLSRKKRWRLREIVEKAV